MNAFRLPDETHIGHVHLQVADLERSLRFYAGLLGFQEVSRAGKTAFLSATGEPLYHILLTEIPNARPKPARTTGLYHMAIRLPSRQELAHVFKRLVDHNWPFHGFSDHKVSEAIYLPDPDGNGLELYRDLSPAQWPWRNGQLAMRTDPLDVEALLQEAEQDRRPWTGIHPDTDIGHVHLHVADLAEAEAFYHGVLGFDVTQRDYPGARFFAAGGYHHHVGTNIWAGQGAPPPPANAVGLRWFSILLPDQPALAEVLERVEAVGVRPVAHDQGRLVRDPSRNAVVLTVKKVPETVHSPATEVIP